MGEAMLFVSSSVGVNICSNLTSNGLLVSEEGVRRAGFDLAASRMDGCERGSGRRILERDEDEDAMDGATSLLAVEVEKPVEVEKLVEVEKVEATERRDRNDEFEDVYDEATELRPVVVSCDRAEFGRNGRTRL